MRARPRHDQLTGGDGGRHEGLADLLGVRGLGAIDGVDEHGEAGQRSRGRLRDVATARIVLLLLESSSACRMRGFLAWRSRAKKERVRCPSMSSFISSMNAGSTHPAFWAMSTLGA